MTLPATVEDLAARVDAELAEIVASRDMPLYDMMAYHMGWSDRPGGSEGAVPRERTLGLLCLLACRAAGGDPEVALPVAAAVELVHNFCEIHDDVQGGNPQRYGRDAVWWVWGPAQAINAGDGMHALARLALFRLLEKGVPAPTTFRVVELLDEASLETCEGRFLDLEAQERIDLNVEAYLRMASSKTGALVACAMRLGALVATDAEEVIDALAECGAKIGLAMQLSADLRELWGAESDSGASPEVMNKQKLLPVVYAFERSDISAKRRLGDIYFKRVLDADDVIRLREMLDDMGARQASEDLVATYRSAAASALDVAGIAPDAKEEIERLIDRVT